MALHGFTGGGGDFAPLAEIFPEYPWLAPDLPGHAPELSAPGAPSDDCGLEASLKYLDAFIGKAATETKVLLGYSLGGRLALRYALARPGRITGLALIGTSPGIQDDAERMARREEDEILAKKILAKGVTAFLDEWQKHPLIATQARLSAALRAAMRDRRLRLRKEGLAASLRQFGQGSLESAWSKLGELRVPVLLCAGVEDEKYTAIAHAMQARCSQAEVFIVPNAGHMAHLENRDAFAARLRAFLKKIK